MSLAMISQPIAGKTESEVKATRNKAVKRLESIGYTVANTLYLDDGYYSLEALEELGVINVPLFYLAKALEDISKCDTAYFCDGWEDYRGCLIEHTAAKLYGLNVLYESDGF